MTSCSGLPPTCPRKWWIVWSPIRAAVPRFRNCSRTLSCRFTEAPEQRKPAVSDDRRAFFDSGGRLAGFANQVAGMQTTLFMGGFLPPPAAFALVLAGQYRAVVVDRVRDVIRFVDHVCGGCPSAAVHGVRVVLVQRLQRSLVRHWVGVHDGRLAVLARVVRVRVRERGEARR